MRNSQAKVVIPAASSGLTDSKTVPDPVHCLAISLIQGSLGRAVSIDLMFHVITAVA